MKLRSLSLPALTVGIAFCGLAGCAAHSPQVSGPRVDLAQVRFAQGYQQLAHGTADSAGALFAEGLRWARENRTGDETGQWGRALTERLRGHIGHSDSLVMKLPQAKRAESLFANGWLTEVSGDTLASLAMYARSVHADTLWPPPYVRCSQCARWTWPAIQSAAVSIPRRHRRCPSS